MPFNGFVFPCERCGRKFYELTSKFEAEPPMKGHYVRLRKRYGPSGYNWHDFPKQEWVIGDNVACVGCGHPIKVQYILSCLKKKEPKKRSKKERGKKALIETIDELQKKDICPRTCPRTI